MSVIVYSVDGYCAVLFRSAACAALEEADKMLRIFEAEHIPYLRHRQGEVVKQLARGIDQSVGNHVLCRCSCAGLDKLAEVSGRQIQPVGEKGHGRQTPFADVIGQVLIKQGVEFLDYGIVDYLARIELALVKTQAVVKKHLKMRYYDGTRMAVYAVFHLAFNQREHRAQQIDLLFRKVQGFVAAV